MLLIITLVAGIALGITDALTRDPIAEQEKIQAENARKAVLPEADAFEEIQVEDGASVNWIYRGLKDGSPVGYVAQITEKGFGGKIDITVGTDAEGVISGVRIGGSDFSETPGLGANSKNPKFYEQFAGKQYPVDLTKNDGEIDAIASATITSSAVIRGVNSAVKAVAGVAGFQLNEPAVLVNVLDDGRYSVQAKGVTGTFDVIIGVDENGAVSSMALSDPSTGEDVPFLGKVKSSADFLDKFIGARDSADIQPIDTVTGATVSSGAVKDAAGTILLYVNDPAAFAAQMAQQTEEDTIDTSIPEGAVTFTATGSGLTGTFDVTIGVDENGAVNGISIGDASTEQDAPFLNKVKEDNAFLSKFLGVTGKVNEGEIDAVAGATASSKGVIAAVNEALSASRGEEKTEPAPVETVDTSIPEGAVTFTATGSGLTGTFDVTIGVDENGAVNGISIGDASTEQDAPFLNKVKDDNAFLAKFLGVTEKVNADEIDAVAGATASSKGVIAAVNEALALAGDNGGETPAAPTDVPVTEAPVPEPTPAPVETAVPTPTEQPASTDVKTLPASDSKALGGESLVFFTAVKADVSFENGVITDATITSTQVGGEYAPMAQTEKFSALLVGMKAPVSANDLRVSGVPDYVSAAVALAVNDAYCKAQPAEETLPASNENQPAESAFTASGSALVFFTGVKADVNIQDGVITEAALSSARVGGEYAPMAQAEQFSALLKGMKAPVSANDLRVSGVPDYVSAAVALAVNDACGKSQPAAEELPETKEEQPAAESTSSGSSLIFFTAIRTEAAFEGSTLSDFTLESSAAGQNAWEPMDQEQAYLEALIGKTMPLSDSDVHVAGDAQDRAVQIALNEAYAAKDGTKTDASVEAPEQTSLEKKAYTGECVIFFERVIADAAFEDGKVAEVSVTVKNLTDETTVDSALTDWAALLGQPLPLDPDAYTFSGMEDYLGKAVVIAVNQAYEQSLAGQQ